MDGVRLSGECPEARYCQFPKVSAERPKRVRAKRGKCPERVRNVSGRQSSGAGRTPPFYKGVLSDPVAPPSSRVPDIQPRPVSACLALVWRMPPNSAAHPTVSRPHMRRAA